MITTNKVDSLNFVKIINDLFEFIESKDLSTEYNLTEEKIKRFNLFWKNGGDMNVLLDPINMKLFIDEKGFKIKDKKFELFGKTIYLGSFFIKRYKRNKVFKDFFANNNQKELNKEIIIEFLKSNSFKNKILELADNAMKERLESKPSSYLHQISNRRIVLSEATVAQKLYTYYYYDTFSSTDIDMDTFEIPQNSELLIKAKNEILNILIAKNNNNVYDFSLWFDIEFSNLALNPMSEFLKIYAEKPKEVDKPILSKKNKKFFLSLLKSDDINYNITIDNNVEYIEIIDMLKDDFIFNYNLHSSLSNKLTGDYIAFYIDKLIEDEEKNSQTSKKTQIVKIPKTITDLYVSKDEFDKFNQALSALNLERANFIHPITTVHIIEGNPSILDRFI